MGPSRKWVIGVIAVVCLVCTASPAAADSYDRSCTVPAYGAQKCGPAFEVSGKQSVRVTLHASDEYTVGFCVDSDANNAELGACRAIKERETSAVLWTNSDPGRVAVHMRANVDRLRPGDVGIRFTVDVS